MAVEVREEPITRLPEYGRVPIAFRVESQFRVEPAQGGLGGLRLVEEAVAPYVKDYDAIPGEGPSEWPRRWDITHWGILSAFDGGRRVGGAALAWRTQGLDMLAGRDDGAMLWDLRVHPDSRGRGVGHLLFARALAWARERQCRRLTVETQNVNVPACRFYARQGCELGAISRHAYGTLDEVQLLWHKDTEATPTFPNNRQQDASVVKCGIQRNRGMSKQNSSQSEASSQWAADWLAGVADGSNTMSQRRLSSVEKRGGGLEAVKALAEEKGVHLLLVEDDKGDELVVASTKPFQVVC